MNIKPNIGLLNALIRITIGLTVLSAASAKFAKKPWRQSYLLLMMLGAMKVAEGIVKYCPLTALYQCREERMNDQRLEKEGLAEIMPHNPS